MSLQDITTVPIEDNFKNYIKEQICKQHNINPEDIYDIEFRNGEIFVHLKSTVSKVDLVITIGEDK